MSRHEQFKQHMGERELEAARRARRLRKRAGWKIATLPFYDIAVGPDPDRHERRGHARGFIAIGDVATGVIAIGGVARGVLAIGGCAIGLVSFGVLSIGVLLAAGGLAVGGIAYGGGAAGGVAMGLEAAGFYACADEAVGAHVISDDRRDPEAVVFFAERGLARICGHPDLKGKAL